MYQSPRLADPHTHEPIIDNIKETNTSDDPFKENVFNKPTSKEQYKCPSVIITDMDSPNSNDSNTILPSLIYDFQKSEPISYSSTFVIQTKDPNSYSTIIVEPTNENAQHLVNKEAKRYLSTFRHNEAPFNPPTTFFSTFNRSITKPLYTTSVSLTPKTFGKPIGQHFYCFLAGFFHS